jgi:DNA-binding NarL/FixJ family response regulator
VSILDLECVVELNNRRIRVLVADDSPTALVSVCKYLEFEKVFEIVGTASDGRNLLHHAKHLRPDLVLTDLSMPRMSGLQAALELRRSFPEMRILIFTELSGVSLRDECLQCGADGFVEKSQMPEKLMQEVYRLFPRNLKQE